jgi:tripartite ATP-independent transporter DctP family solute receptor
MKLISRLRRHALLAAAVTSLVGLSTPAWAAKYVIKVSHAVTVHHPGHKAMEKFKEKVEAASKGQIEVRIFHSSQLAGQREGVEGLQAGSIEITLTPNGVAAAFDPTFALLDIPFQFTDAAHARRFLDKGGEKMLFANLDKVGLLGLAAWEQGFRNLATVKAPALKAADMRGLKLRTMEAPLHITAWKAVGSNPTPIGWAQVYTSLQQGIIDGVENPSYIFSQTPVHEQLKFLALTKHIYDPILVLGSKAFFDKLPADLRTLVTSTLSGLTPLQREYVDADVIKAETKDLPGFGVKVLDVAPAAMTELAAASQPPVLKEVERRVGAPTLKTWQSAVDAAR